jgi:Ca2+-binding RTX toxin-like protein
MTKTVDFNNLSSGTIVDNEYLSDGVTIQAWTAKGDGDRAMIFDTANPTGGDDDLATQNLGKVLIVSEDGDSSDPDNAIGGTFRFFFADGADVKSLTFLDNEEDATVRFYGENGRLIATRQISATDDNGQYVATFNVEGAYTMDVQLHGSGAVDNLVFDDISTLDGIVSGTAGDDVIDAGYKGDPDGDRVDNNDAILDGDLGDDDLIVASAGDDLVLAGDGDDEVYGGVGDDTLRGQDGEDVLFGKAGNDILEGMNDNDVMFGGAGDDVLYGGAGNDILIGSIGDDLIVGGDGNDVLIGGQGDDSLDGGAGEDTIFGGAGDDTVTGGQDGDNIFGGAGNDDLEGGLGNDTLDGGACSDLIFGGAGVSDLSGGFGSDTFFGGNGGDVVTCGEDADNSDIDVLDLTGSNVQGIKYVEGDPESGTVTFQDGSTMTFSEIENVIPCFTPGTLIATPKGERPVEELQVGDRIITRDNGIQEIAWIGHKPMSGAQLVQNPHLQPVLIKRGALGRGLPECDMIVSPNHRVLVSSDKTQLYFDESEVLAVAKHMVGADGIHSINVLKTTYVHFMFERHEVVLSNGAWTESFQPGDYSLKGIGNSQRTEIFDLFPELSTKKGLKNYHSARKTLKKYEAKLLRT